jgi:methylated-DNA-[protein]-cysteine S-methyltransferase
MENIFHYDTGIGKIGIAEKGGNITNLFFEIDSYQHEYRIKETDILKKANNQLQEYLSGCRKEFSLPLAPNGTEFMKNVWNSLSDVSFGETRSYKEIAEIIGNPKAYRAVGSANNKNPIPIFIPCHRVIGANGKLVGYRGGLEVKGYLLNLEKTIV